MPRHVDSQNTLVLYGGLTILSLVSVVALLYFAYVSAVTIQDMATLPAVISFDKGAFYLLGAGAGLSALIVAGIYESCLGRQLSKRTASIITKVALGGFIVMLALPHVTDYLVSGFLSNQGYVVCHDASRQWLHSTTIVYARNNRTCLEAPEEETTP